MERPGRVTVKDGVYPAATSNRLSSVTTCLATSMASPKAAPLPQQASADCGANLPSNLLASISTRAANGCVIASDITQIAPHTIKTDFVFLVPDVSCAVKYF
jgi:hypothetical protein